MLQAELALGPHSAALRSIFWSPPEIAARMGKSEEAVHGLHHRGRRALRADLTARDLAPMTMAA